MTQVHIKPSQLLLKSSHFKDDVLSIRYLFPNEEPSITTVNLLSFLMTDRTHAYPTKKEMNVRMDELYGLSIQTKTSSIGYTHVLEFRVKALNQRYTKDLDFKQIEAFVLECILHPLINEETFKEACVNMMSALERAEDNPSLLGFRIAAEAVSTSEPLKWFNQGSRQVLSTLKMSDVKRFHSLMIQQKPMIFLGSDKDRSLDHLFSSLGNHEIDYRTAYTFPVCTPKHRVVKKTIPQSTLTHLYATQIGYNDDDYLALRIMTIVLGQLPSSLLFTEIREKRSLCYSIHATTLNFDGVMLIQTGIDSLKQALVNQLIETQIERLKAGKFNTKLVSMAKKLMISSMETIEDDRSSYFNFIYQRMLNHRDYKIPELIKQIRLIEKKDVIRVAHKLSLVSTSLVEGEQR